MPSQWRSAALAATCCCVLLATIAPTRATASHSSAIRNAASHSSAIRNAASHSSAIRNAAGRTIVVPDGSASGRAAASCWGIKQAVPTAADGLYWLLTPQLVAPRQFWCDMTTDGGGWVLIGRGREGWSWRDRGQGNAGNVARPPSGPEAFAVQYYPAALVDALLAGTRPDALDDGIRIRRATDTTDAADTTGATGTAWREIRYRPVGMAQWSWAFGGRTPTLSPSRSLWLSLWRREKGENRAVPFTQVYLRPRLAAGAATGSAVPDAGLPASTVPHLLSQVSEPLAGWGVTGDDPAAGPAPGWRANVIALAQVGDSIFVGGTFHAVQRGPGGTALPQRYLAAFDRRTGAYLPAFAPVLDSGVWALAVTPGGRLIVGGRFTRVNGLAEPGLVALDPATGGVDRTWNASPAASSGVASVRSLAVQDDWVYVGGTMTSISGGFGPQGRRIAVDHLARVSSQTGRPDAGFRPVLSGEPWSITTSVRGDRVYLAGDFTLANGAAVNGTAVVDPASGGSVPGLEPIAPSAPTTPSTPSTPSAPIGPSDHPHARALLESRDGRRVFAAAGEHAVQLLDTATLAGRYESLSLSGGDYRSLAESDGVLYATCQCFGFDDSGRPLPRAAADFGPSGTADLGSSSTVDFGSSSTADFGSSSATERISSVNGLIAYDSATLRQLDGFEPSWRGAYDDGVWASLVDSAGCVWFGGDIVQGSLARWAGGFVTYCPRDSSAPLAPESLAVSRSAAGATLSWAGGGDASGAVTFQVLREDRVVAVTTAHAWTDPDGYPGARYAVRTADATGNLSATTPVRTLSG